MVERGPGAAEVADELVRLVKERPLGDALVTGFLTDGPPFVNPLSDAADNLLAKARKAMIAGDPARADRYVERALRLPFDEVEEVRPALWSVYMGVYSVITDAVESAGEDESSWLDAAERVAEAAGAGVREPVVQVLGTVPDAYQLLPRERRRVEAIRRRYPDVPAEPAYERNDLDDASCAQVVRDGLRAQLMYQAALGGRR